jgi:hypothetical protein
VISWEAQLLEKETEVMSVHLMEEGWLEKGMEEG